MEVLVPFLLDAQEEIVDLIRRKYTQPCFSGAAGERPVQGVDPGLFSHLLILYAEDPEVRAIIRRRYRECGRILGIARGSHSKMGDFFERLDEESRSLLLFLYEKGHATLNELSTLTRSSHFEVLYRLQEIVIPESMHQYGRPLVSFAESRIDPLTGERISFSWWWNDELIHESGQIEMTEEDKTLTITADLAGSELPRRMRASASFKHGVLEIRVNKGGKSDER